MADEERSKTVARWASVHGDRATAIGTGANADVIDCLGHRIWLGVPKGLTPRLTSIARRLCAGRANPGGLMGKALREADEVIFGASRGATVIGTIVVRMDSPAGLHADVRHADVVHALRREGRSLCEFDRLALNQGEDAEEILCRLFRVASLYAQEARKATDILAEVHPLHAGTYRRLLGFRRASEGRPAALFGASRVLLRLELVGVGEQMGKRWHRPALDAEDCTEVMRRIRAAMIRVGWQAPRLSASAAGPKNGISMVAIKPKPSAGVDAAPSPLTAPLDTRTYDEGLRAGVQARVRRQPIGAYQRVGLDAYARGFRAGYYVARGAHTGGRAAS